MSDNTDEGYNEFIKEYGLRESWCNKTWDEWDDLFCEIKTYWKTKAVRHWRENILKQFVYSLPVVRNPTALFHVFIQSDAFYLPQILSLIELTYGPFAVERYETTKKIKFMFISQKCSKYYNLFRFHINSFLIFFGVSYLSTAKGPYMLNLLGTSFSYKPS